MVDEFDKEDIQIEIVDNSINRLNLHELLQYSLRQLLEGQLKGKDCSRIQNRLDAINRAVAREELQHLIMLTNKKSFRMPSGLTREERRSWAKSNRTR